MTTLPILDEAVSLHEGQWWETEADGRIHCGLGKAVPAADRKELRLELASGAVWPELLVHGKTEVLRLAQRDCVDFCVG